MKKNLQFWILGCVLLFLAACSNMPNAESEVKAFLTDFKNAQFSVDASDLPTLDEQTIKMESYVTEVALVDMLNNRSHMLPMEVADRHKADITVEVSDVEMEVREGGKYDFNYVITLKVGEDGEATFNGQSTVEKIEGQWKVSRDFFKADALLSLLE